MSLTGIIKNKVNNIKKELYVIYFAYKHPEVGILPKFIIMLTIGYAISPIDLIPDFIPVLGYLDDIIIIPFLLFLSYKLISKDVLNICREKAENKIKINLKSFNKNK